MHNCTCINNFSHSVHWIGLKMWTNNLPIFIFLRQIYRYMLQFLKGINRIILRVLLQQNTDESYWLFELFPKWDVWGCCCPLLTRLFNGWKSPAWMQQQIWLKNYSEQNQPRFPQLLVFIFCLTNTKHFPTECNSSHNARKEKPRKSPRVPPNSATNEEKG